MARDLVLRNVVRLCGVPRDKRADRPGPDVRPGNGPAQGKALPPQRFGVGGHCVASSTPEPTKSTTDEVGSRSMPAFGKPGSGVEVVGVLGVRRHSKTVFLDKAALALGLGAHRRFLLGP